MAHQARKRFGQNFLSDESIPAAIVAALHLKRDDNLVEIGPGLAALTKPLMEKIDHLKVIEIDRDLAHRLRNSYSEERLSIVEADVLRVDFSQFGERFRLVGNLPYNISSPLLFHLMDYAEQIIDQHFMLQKEVIDRMVAQPGSSDYSRLTVMLQARYSMEKLFDVPPECFDPPPKVMSSIVRMTPLDSSRPQAKNHKAFEQVVSRAFEQRRKMLRRSLSQWQSFIDWDSLGIAETARPETLSVAQFIALADALYDAGVFSKEST